MESPNPPVTQPGPVTQSLSADTFEAPADPNVLIYSNVIMAVERLGDTLDTRIGSAMSTVAASMKEMTAAFEKQQRRLQVHSSSEDTCMVGALASRPCSQGGADGTASLSFGGAASSHPCSEGGTLYDFKNHGCQSPPKSPVPSCGRSVHSLEKWGTRGDLHLQGVDSDDSPSKHSVLSLEAGDVDEFDLAVRKMTTQKTIPGSPQPPPLGTPLMDNMYSTYMDEYQPDSVVGPGVSDDLARTVNLWEKTLC